MEPIERMVESNGQKSESIGVGKEVTIGGTDWSLGFFGAESRIWFGVYNGLDVVRKERFVKNYRIKELDSRLTRERIRAEVRAIMKIKAKCPELGALMPSILFVDEKDIIMTRITDSVNVCQYLLQSSTKEESMESLDELLSNLGQTIARIHNCGVIQGDLTTSNFLVKDNKQNQLIPIDFGLASFSTSSEDRAVDLYVLERAIISTHPNVNFETVLQSYDKHIISTKNDVLKRLEVVRLRGRKRLLIG